MSKRKYILHILGIAVVDSILWNVYAVIIMFLGATAVKLIVKD